VPRAIWQRRYVAWLRVADFLIVVAAVVVAQLLRFGTTPATLAGPTSLGYSAVSILIIGCWVWFLTIYRTRARGVIGGGADEFRRLWTATPSLFGAIAIVATVFKVA
jgi:hypothetical protein